MIINKYPDGSTYTEGTYNVPNPSIMHKINDYKDLWILNQIVDALNNQGISPVITIPNLIDAQADRRFSENQSSNLKLVCKFLNGMNAKFKIFHPHNSEVVEALIDNVKIIDNSEFISTVLSEIYLKDKIRENLILMSSDAGGFKPLMKLCDKINWQGETHSANKSRKCVDGKSQLTQLVDRQDFQGKDILIIDDISVYGGTFKGLSRLLKERNCGKLYLAVSHMTVQNLGEDPVTNYFDRVFTTNSKFDRYFRKTGEDCNSNLHYAEEIYEENLEIIKLF